MNSFKKFCENKENSPLDDENSLKAIRNGLGIKENFWEDFLALINNAEVVSSLLKVPVEKIGTWRNLIKQGLKKVHDSDNEIIPKDKKRLLKTGLPEEI